MTPLVLLRGTADSKASPERDTGTWRAPVPFDLRLDPLLSCCLFEAAEWPLPCAKITTRQINCSDRVKRLSTHIGKVTNQITCNVFVCISPIIT